VLVFALWYWRLDAGDRTARQRPGHNDGAFLFPQMAMPPDIKKQQESIFGHKFCRLSISCLYTRHSILSNRCAVLARGQIDDDAPVGHIVNHFGLLAARAVKIL